MALGTLPKSLKLKGRRTALKPSICMRYTMPARSCVRLVEPAPKSFHPPLLVSMFQAHADPAGRGDAFMASRVAWHRAAAWQANKQTARSIATTQQADQLRA